MNRKTMLPLRFGAVVCNVVFLVFGLLVPGYPTVVLHGLLLPLNFYRAWKMICLVRKIRESAEDDNNLNVLFPYMSKT